MVGASGYRRRASKTVQANSWRRDCWMRASSASRTLRSNEALGDQRTVADELGGFGSITSAAGGAWRIMAGVMPVAGR